jgi:aryl-alcohol dehydrogenase-like predicted oxidoreductase
VSLYGFIYLVVNSLLIDISQDTPAWVVSRANQWARDHGKTPFCIYQGQWSILERSFERDIIPMARAEGLALAPWGVIGQGRLMTDAEEQRRRETGEEGRKFGSNWERNPNEVKVSRKLEEIAKEVGAEHISAVALAYVMHVRMSNPIKCVTVDPSLQKTTYVFPIVGGRKVDHLHGNIMALDIKLTPEQIKSLESVLPFDQGFPNSMIVSIMIIDAIGVSSVFT